MKRSIYIDETTEQLVGELGLLREVGWSGFVQRAIHAYFASNVNERTFTRAVNAVAKRQGDARRADIARKATKAAEGKAA